MNSLKKSPAAKITAFFLLVLMIAASFGGALCTLYMAREGYFNDSGSNYYNSRSCVNTVNMYSNKAFDTFSSSQNSGAADGTGNLSQLDNDFSKDHSNFIFTITDEAGTVLYSNYSQQKFGSVMTHQYFAGKAYKLNSYIRDPITAKDNFYSSYKLFNSLYPSRVSIVAGTAAAAVITLVLAVFLLSAAGYRKGKEGITLILSDRIPLDLYAGGVLLILYCLAQAMSSDTYVTDDFVSAAWIGFLATAVSLLLFALAMTFSVRYKKGKWWQNTICYKFLMLFAKFGKFILYLLANLPLLWKTLLLFGGYIFANGILVMIFAFEQGSAQGVAFFIGLLFNSGALAFLCMCVLQMQRIKKAGENLAEGDYTSLIDIQTLRGDFKAHAENLNNISLGMSKAVDARMKSERFKTELITNVSHDIKTPLTSIVNYVDLLKKEEITDEKLLKYISILDRQSARLKKLTEDLVEASKASTGNMTVNPVRTDLYELLQQSVGEYAQRFAENHLEAVIRSPEGEAAVLADGQLLWRVFDNLFSNICKYTQSETRVYIDIERAKQTFSVTIKNTSRYPLNITADELLERFVRGDISRATEGSGLGLSIAQSLTELQHGIFTLAIDGDLFKVTVALPVFQ